MKIEIIKGTDNNPLAEFFSSSSTPETDKFKIKFKTPCGEKYWVPVEHSERLERERDEALKLFISSKRARASLSKACDSLQKELRETKRERNELLQWKKEMLLVESQWDEQAVGKLLGLQLGDYIKANIELKLRQLIRERDEARDALSEIALYLSVGMGDESTTAKQYYERILDGIKMFIDPLQDRIKTLEEMLDMQTKIVVDLEMKLMRYEPRIN